MFPNFTIAIPIFLCNFANKTMNQYHKSLYARIVFLLVALASWSCSEKENITSIDTDSYAGNFTNFLLNQEAEGLSQGDISIAILAEDGTVFTRDANHLRSDGISTIRMQIGLKEGVYRLLFATIDSPNPDEEIEFGLGSRIKVSSEGIAVIDSYNSQLGCAGEGSKEDPFIISSSSHLFNLMMAVNDYDYNKYITDKTYFQQVCDIDMKSMSRSCDAEYGWMPIGADTNTPFRGVYRGDNHVIKNLIIKRPNSAGIGLFGYIHGGAIDGLTMQKCSVEGQFAAGIIAGAVVSSGNNMRGSGTFTNCTLSDCTLSGNSSSAMIGGVLGGIDMHTTALIADCSTSGGSVSGGMAVGGIFGGAGMYSSLIVSGCENSTPVTSVESGAGGIVGNADTLMVTGSRNFAMIQGPKAASKQSSGLGTGGIVGGSGFSWITSSSNEGKIVGFEGVGGIIGSTRVRGSESESLLYNQSVLRYCTNAGEVTGSRFIGGAIGEAQAGGFSVVNTGTVSGSDYVGGICGGSSLAVIHNSINGGKVTADSHVAGIVGKCTWGSLAVNQNVGEVSATKGWAGGICGLAGNNTVIHYCSNFNSITSGSGWVGGIVGDIGEPREWTGMDIAECVIGSIECVMAVAGPCLAVFEGAVELAEAVEVTIKVVETSIELSLQISDYVLEGFSIDELINPEVEEELKANMYAVSQDVINTNNDMMNELRMKCKSTSPYFSGYDMTPRYMGSVNRLMNWYSQEGNDEVFNDIINERREARAEQLEKAAKMKEIVHTTIAGVAVVASTVALVAGEVATGGAATAFIAVGATAALVGGVNAIVKSCTEFEKNAVIISQCVNASKVSSNSHGKASSIAGRICDGSVIYDCLNTSPDGGDEEFAADINSHCGISRCLAVAPHEHDDVLWYFSQCIYADPNLSGNDVYSVDGMKIVSLEALSKKSTFEEFGFSIGEGGLWILNEGDKYPYPNYSEMQKMD